VFFMPERIIDLENPELGPELLRDAKGSFPIDVWRVYVLCHSAADDCPASVIGYCDQPCRSTLDPQQAVDEAWELLAKLFFTNLPPRSCKVLLMGIVEAQLLLYSAHSNGRKRGQPTSMRHQAVRAYLIRKFNPHPKKPNESTVGWDRVADLLFVENGRCKRCSVGRHRYDSDCVKDLISAVRRLKRAMKDDGIPF
jgi:hypothetical protein